MFRSRAEDGPERPLWPTVPPWLAKHGVTSTHIRYSLQAFVIAIVIEAIFFPPPVNNKLALTEVFQPGLILVFAYLIMGARNLGPLPLPRCVWELILSTSITCAEALAIFYLTRAFWGGMAPNSAGKAVVVGVLTTPFLVFHALYASASPPRKLFGILLNANLGILIVGGYRTESGPLYVLSRYLLIYCCCAAVVAQVICTFVLPTPVGLTSRLALAGGARGAAKVMRAVVAMATGPVGEDGRLAAARDAGGGKDAEDGVRGPGLLLNRGLRAEALPIHEAAHLASLAVLQGLGYAGAARFDFETWERSKFYPVAAAWRMGAVLKDLLSCVSSILYLVQPGSAQVSLLHERGDRLTRAADGLAASAEALADSLTRNAPVARGLEALGRAIVELEGLAEDAASLPDASSADPDRVTLRLALSSLVTVAERCREALRCLPSMLGANQPSAFRETSGKLARMPRWRLTRMQHMLDAPSPGLGKQRGVALDSPRLSAPGPEERGEPGLAGPARSPLEAGVADDAVRAASEGEAGSPSGGGVQAGLERDSEGTGLADERVGGPPPEGSGASSKGKGEVGAEMDPVLSPLPPLERAPEPSGGGPRGFGARWARCERWLVSHGVSYTRPGMIGGIQCTLAFYIILALEAITPVWEGLHQRTVLAIITVMVLIEPTAGASLRKGVQRITGTILGSALALAIVYLTYLCNGLSYANKPQKFVFHGLFLAIAASLLTFGMSWLPNDTFFYSSALMALGTGTTAGYLGDSPLWSYVLWRALLNVIGAAVVSLVTIVVFPTRSSRIIRKGAGSVLDGLAKTVETAASRYRPEVGDEDDDEGLSSVGGGQAGPIGHRDLGCEGTPGASPGRPGGEEGEEREASAWIGTRAGAALDAEAGLPGTLSPPPEPASPTSCPAGEEAGTRSLPLVRHRGLASPPNPPVLRSHPKLSELAFFDGTVQDAYESDEGGNEPDTDPDRAADRQGPGFRVSQAPLTRGEFAGLARAAGLRDWETGEVEREGAGVPDTERPSEGVVAAAGAARQASGRDVPPAARADERGEEDSGSLPLEGWRAISLDLARAVRGLSGAASEAGAEGAEASRPGPPAQPASAGCAGPATSPASGHATRARVLAALSRASKLRAPSAGAAAAPARQLPGAAGGAPTLSRATIASLHSVSAEAEANPSLSMGVFRMPRALLLAQAEQEWRTLPRSGLYDPDATARERRRALWRQLVTPPTPALVREEDGAFGPVTMATFRSTVASDLLLSRLGMLLPALEYEVLPWQRRSSMAAREAFISFRMVRHLFNLTFSLAHDLDSHAVQRVQVAGPLRPLTELAFAQVAEALRAVGMAARGTARPSRAARCAIAAHTVSGRLGRATLQLFSSQHRSEGEAWPGDGGRGGDGAGAKSDGGPHDAGDDAAGVVDEGASSENPERVRGGRKGAARARPSAEPEDAYGDGARVASLAAFLISVGVVLDGLISVLTHAIYGVGSEEAREVNAMLKEGRDREGDIGRLAALAVSN